MLPAERQRAIEELVNHRGSIRVKELSRTFEVTEETVRRDLDILENQGKIRRSHGGAVRIHDDHTETHYSKRESQNITEKEAIAREAVNHIVPGDTIVLDASTSAWHLALVLPNIEITVVTNSMKAALELANRDKMEVICTGGLVRTSSLSCIGPLTEDTLEQFHVNKAFLSCKGIHTDYGISESNSLQALVKRKMIDMSDNIYILADHTKIQIRDFTSVARLSEIDALITDSNVSSETLEEIRHYGINVIAVDSRP